MVLPVFLFREKPNNLQGWNNLKIARLQIQIRYGELLVEPTKFNLVFIFLGRLNQGLLGTLRGLGLMVEDQWLPMSISNPPPH
jgi:hypothetical protein